ncbi:MAG: acyl-CoA thioesterase [Bacteroidota bacterium]|nr:acyl-CoA thioesterase [Bacteroidota bacterium]
MYSHETDIRVRYGETDQMGYLYYGNYAQFYEVARVEAIRNLGLSYKALEDSGISLPVLDMESTFIKPALYDEVLKIKASIREIPNVKIRFYYEIRNQEDELITIGNTTLVFFDMEKRKPCRPPKELLSSLKPYFS